MSTPLESLRWQNHFVERLPGDPVAGNHVRQVLNACYSRVEPTTVSSPKLVALVPEVAALLDLDPGAATAEVLAGNRVLPGMKPYAACYGGHQFGHWARQLGDGRAITLGELENAKGERYELQLKGAGPTPYSRRADGRAVLRSSLRELACSEAMHHLGVPTTRALSLVLTGDPVMRDMFYDGNAQMEPGAITCRVAPSFLRFGSYEIHASRRDLDTLRTLVDFTLEQWFPGLDVPAFFEEVCRRTARLMVEWMRVGFVHGVMNTDNMSILGLTIDYGPYGWLDVFDPDWTPNTTDVGERRYRYGQQPAIAHWNLMQLARALSPLVDDIEKLQRGLDTYEREITAGYPRMLLGKLGLTERDGDEALLESLLALLTSVEVDMSLFYRRLADVRAVEDAAEKLRDAWYSEAPPALGAWIERYLERVRAEGVSDEARRRRMNAVNPLYVPRNYLVQQVIDRVEQGDQGALEELLDVFRRPYDAQPGREAFAQKRPEWARSRAGCSMLSCSS